jgi:soluble lytic murein transglycosylase-like protein
MGTIEFPVKEELEENQCLFIIFLDNKMKADEFLTERQLDEIDLRKAGAKTALGMAAFNALVTNPIYNHGDERPQGVQQQIQAQDNRARTPVKPPTAQPAKKVEPPPATGFVRNEIKPDEAAQKIAKRFKLEPEVALNIVNLAKKHEKPGFPRADDILSVIGIESGFNPKAVSNLKKDPALGLTQVRAKMWGQNPKTFINDIDKQIEVSSDILADYNQQLKNPLNAVHAYNIGIGAFQKGEYNPDYVRRFQREKQFYNK